MVRETALTNQNTGLVYKYVSLREKIKLSVAGVFEYGRKKMVSTSQKISFH